MAATVTPALHSIDIHRIDGTPTTLGAFRGRLLLVVNVASRCGFTPQYEGLQRLHADLADEGFTVLGFPCDQFGHQEPGGEEEIRGFCDRTFGVTFPMFAKVDVNGPRAHPLFRWLRSEAGGLLGERVKWNFTKFLVGRDGRVIGRYAPTTTPDRIRADVEKALLGDRAA
jgi:glutathione peroxidase